MATACSAPEAATSVAPAAPTEELATLDSTGAVSPITTIASTGPVSPTPTVASKGGVSPTLTVMTHDSFNVSEALVRTFESTHQVKLQFLKAGDAGAALNRAILTKSKPLADVFYGVDNTFLSRALSAGIFEPYHAPALDQIPAAFKLDPADGALPVDYGDVCVNYDKSHFARSNGSTPYVPEDIPYAKATRPAPLQPGIPTPQRNPPPPAKLEDLTDPAYKDLLVVENPATSSPGLAFLLATIGHFGEGGAGGQGTDGGYLDYWRALRRNGVKVVNDWETAYNQEFSGSAGRGPRPLVVSYGSSPPFEVIFADPPPAEAPTGAIVSDGSCFRQIEFVGILKGISSASRALAEAWVDFMLARTFQEDMPLQMYVFPVNPTAQLSEAFQKYLAIPANPVTVDPAAIAAKREQWIEAWTAAVLR